MAVPRSIHPPYCSEPCKTIAPPIVQKPTRQHPSPEDSPRTVCMAHGQGSPLLVDSPCARILTPFGPSCRARVLAQCPHGGQRREILGGPQSAKYSTGLRSTKCWWASELAITEYWPHRLAPAVNNCLSETTEAISHDCTTRSCIVKPARLKASARSTESGAWWARAPPWRATRRRLATHSTRPPNGPE